MKSILFSLLVIAIFSSCGGPKCVKHVKEADSTKLTPAVVGTDADEHGCRASAGYQWSVLQQQCIRVFELPVQIISQDSTTRTGLIISADRSQAEVFSPSGHFVLNKTVEFQYASPDPALAVKLFINTKGEWVFKEK